MEDASDRNRKKKLLVCYDGNLVDFADRVIDELKDRDPKIKATPFYVSGADFQNPTDDFKREMLKQDVVVMISGVSEDEQRWMYITRLLATLSPDGPLACSFLLVGPGPRATHEEGFFEFSGPTDAPEVARHIVEAMSA